jgi:hypothetical protein
VAVHVSFQSIDVLHGSAFSLWAETGTCCTAMRYNLGLCWQTSCGQY